jgi:hypothetical protein
VCQDYGPPEGYVPIMLNPFEGEGYDVAASLSETNKAVVPFLCCGDLDCFKGDLERFPSVVSWHFFILECIFNCRRVMIEGDKSQIRLLKHSWA